MIKQILYSLIAVAVYLIMMYGYSEILDFFLAKSDFFDTNEEYLILFPSTIIYLILIIVSIIFIKKGNQKKGNQSKVSLRSISLILCITVLFRLLEDPFLRLEIIIGNEPIPSVFYESLSTLELVSLMLNLVLLGAIVEELLFRRVILNFFLPKHLLIGVFFSSFLFTLIHVDYININYITLITSFAFGIVASVVYVKYGLLYSILFHVGYNSIWLFFRNKQEEYWSIIKELNFGIIYWSIVLASLGGIAFFLIKSLKELPLMVRASDRFPW